MKSMKSLFSLEGKNAIITGGAEILRKNFSHGLCEMGANLAILENNLDAAKELAKELENTYGKKVIPILCDVSSPASVKEAVLEVEKKLGSIHILHNNAATKSKDLDAFFAKYEEYSLDEWRKIMNVNLDGMFLMAQAVGAHMVKSQIPRSIIKTPLTN